ncbi:hypothetical protein FraQA3DRAFT_1754 [Frankia sp. QA3]|nr:hypothetical protein FraQA3DRAFT_1754 [Frankia sp. QA3]
MPGVERGGGRCAEGRAADRSHRETVVVRRHALGGIGAITAITGPGTSSISDPEPEPRPSPTVRRGESASPAPPQDPQSPLSPPGHHQPGLRTYLV